MRPRLSARDRRALALGGCVVAAALLWTYAAGPYLRALDQTRARLDAERGLLARELELAADAPALAAEVERAAQRLWDVAPHLFADVTGGLATAAFAEYVRRQARESRVHLASVAPVEAVEARPERTGGGASAPARLTEQALLVSGESDLEGLLTLLARLETGGKLVRVDELAVDAGRAAPQPGGALPLSFRLTAVALSLPGGAAPAPNEEGGT